MSHKRVENTKFGENFVNDWRVRFWLKMYATTDFGLENQERGWPNLSVCDKNLRAVAKTIQNSSLKLSQ